MRTLRPLYILWVSYSIVRAVHFMRTTPLHQWQKQAVSFDAMMRSSIERILGFPMSDLTFAQLQTWWARISDHISRVLDPSC